MTKQTEFKKGDIVVHEDLTTMDTNKKCDIIARVTHTEQTPTDPCVMVAGYWFVIETHTPFKLELVISRSHVTLVRHATPKEIKIYEKEIEPKIQRMLI